MTYKEFLATNEKRNVWQNKIMKDCSGTLQQTAEADALLEEVDEVKF